MGREIGHRRVADMSPIWVLGIGQSLGYLAAISTFIAESTQVGC